MTNKGIGIGTTDIYSMQGIGEVKGKITKGDPGFGTVNIGDLVAVEHRGLNPKIPGSELVEDEEIDMAIEGIRSRIGGGIL